MKDGDTQVTCRYCTDAGDIGEKVADLEVSRLWLTKDQTYRGRCILSLKEHKTEFFQLEGEELQAFARDMAKASKALYKAFSPGKINYAAFGDTYPHLHFHLVPKYPDGKSWGSAFELPLSNDKLASKEELAALVKEIQKHL
ncbi:HIT family protein [Spirochaetia bacterium]|nr:HIT family protein [Spirochaetia bacterium]